MATTFEPSLNTQSEHRIHRIGWLRAAVLGANDGIVSTASLLIGVSAAGTTTENILLAGVSGLVAGAMSMAAGEYVSVSSQSDIERADIEVEKRHLATNYEYEVQELMAIYVERGLDENLAKQVAVALMNHDALGAHARDELGITHLSKPRPVQAAAASAATFAMGAALPLIAVILAPAAMQTVFIAISSLLFLILLGTCSARAGGAPILPAAIRVTAWSSLAMVTTAATGHLYALIT